MSTNSMSSLLALATARRAAVALAGLFMVAVGGTKRRRGQIARDHTNGARIIGEAVELAERHLERCICDQRTVAETSCGDVVQVEIF